MPYLAQFWRFSFFWFIWLVTIRSCSVERSWRHHYWSRMRSQLLRLPKHSAVKSLSYVLSKNPAPINMSSTSFDWTRTDCDEPNKSKKGERSWRHHYWSRMRSQLLRLPKHSAVKSLSYVLSKNPAPINMSSTSFDRTRSDCDEPNK